VASVPQYNSPQESRRPAPLPDVSTPAATPDAFGGTAARNQIRTGETLMRAGAALADVKIDMQRRENADSVFRAETAIKDEHIKQEADWRQNRQGRSAKDLTKDADNWWTEAIKKQNESLATPEQRRLFTQRAEPLRQSSIASASAWESSQLEKSHDESWLANKGATISTAAANPTSGKPYISNADGSVSTERTITIEADDKHYVIPTIVGGKQLSKDDAVKAWRTGDNKEVGAFNSAAEADAFAKQRTSQGGGLGTVDQARLEIDRLNRYQAARKGWEPERLAAENRKDLTVLHKQVIQTLAKDAPGQAEAYFKRYKDEIDGTQQAEIGDFASKASASRLGEDAAAETWAKYGPAKDADPVELDKLEAKMREKFKDNEHARTAGINALKERVAAHNSSQKEREAANVNAVMDGVRNGAGINQVRRLPEFRALPGSERLKIEEHIEARQHLRLARSTEDQTRLEREQLVTYSAAFHQYSDPDVLSRMSRPQVAALEPVMGRHYADSLLTKWETVSRHDAALTEARIDNDAFKTIVRDLGFDPDKKLNLNTDKGKTEAARLGAMRDEVERQIGVAQKDKGRQLTREEKDTVARRVLSSNVLRSGAWYQFGFGGDNVPAASIVPADLKSVAVPPAEREAIRAELKKRGKPATDEEVAKWYVTGKKLQEQR
jgi:hypothetical protein